MFPLGWAQNHTCLQKVLLKIKITQEKIQLWLDVEKKKKKKDKKVGLSESPLFLVCLISVYLATNFKYHLNRTCSVLCMQQPGKTAGSASSV